ncbi:MAG: Gfo/Idh/MocA family oxidoreductase, partial [Phycisphaerales bacterium]|nr:Gfo/Idh/MocA family oxidoreductase [Phycisphaerales bacterium]
VGVIGCGIRARELLGAIQQGAAVVAVCDCDTARRNDYLQRAGGQAGGVKAYADYNELLADPRVELVVIGAPDHHHAPIALAAMARKKDVYCEKPLTLTLAEGKQLIDAARANNTVFQTGSQQRTEFGHRFVEAVERVRAGMIGRVLTVHVGVGVSSRPCDLPEEPMEPGLDWDRWLGPAPKRPYNSVLSPRGVNDFYPNWRLYKEYSGGMMTDFGAHHFDIAQWGLNMDHTGPVAVAPPKDPKADRGATLTYADGTRIVHGGADGVTFIGERGSLFVTRDRTVGNPESVLKDPLPKDAERLPRHKGQIANWLQCVVTRERPICDAEVGARSVACAHLCNQAYWGRKPFGWDPVKWEAVV